MNVKDKGGNVITEENTVMERRRQYFRKLTDTEINMPPEKENRMEKNRMDTRRKVYEALEKIKVGKAPGQDNVTPEMIKYMGEEKNKKVDRTAE